MIIYLKGKRLQLNPASSVGKGGEADIFDIGNGLVLKLFKQPNHPDLSGFKQEQLAAKVRLDEHQRKLPAFPKTLPPRVISPINLATNKNGSKILGYSMRFLKGYEVLFRYSDRNFRQTGISNDLVIQTFKDIYDTVKKIHATGVVIGDFNNLNILTANGEAYLIDADSFQFGGFLCKVFTEKFVDPLLCNPSGTHLMLMKSHNTNSDWYAFNVMLMQSLLFVEPYGGIYKPKDKNKRVKHTERPLKRITIFDQDVKYPKPAIHYSVLPDSLLQQFNLVFKEDKRDEFPVKILDSIRWTSCTKCGIVHARNVCPSCTHYNPSTVVETIRGNVTCTRVFQTSGIILFATIQDDKLKYLFYENGKFKREDNLFTFKGQLKPTMRFRIKKENTLIGYKDQVISLATGSSPKKMAVDNFGSLPMFDSNGKNDFWIYDGRLMRSDLYGPKHIGDVLSNQTLFWVGQQFGFGFYRASNLNVGFIFNTDGGNINDSINLPVITGQLVDSTCFFADSWVWFFISVREKGQTINRCMIIKSDGSIKASIEAKEGDGSWLSSIRNKCVAGNFLLAATDDGIVRVEPFGNSIGVSKMFPDTEPFVDSGCHLFPSNNCLFVVSRSNIKSLKIV